jgi:hypothetical protein
LGRIADREAVAEEPSVDLGDVGSVFVGDRAQSVVQLGEDVDDLRPRRQAQAGGVTATGVAGPDQAPIPHAGTPTTGVVPVGAE